MTLFLQEAAARGCTLVYGYSMFIEQAVLQWVAWRPEVNREACRAILETRVAPILL
jgi:shikimate 5-dehydrogenase